ncbi:ROK family protein [Lysinibacter sp. HNR]|uniref:ROK family protein n=1 Tax=Lysinibacter sp. HNR TaxID=3031408 RepID=UPI002434B051|nr:ROK family protein [Lysinibacter sp. HNR]WGD38018.1 ROK family protein [Lysinibacter sp. HNR]
MRVGIDIGGTKTEAVLLDADGQVVHTVKVPTGHGREQVLSTAVGVARELAARFEGDVTDFASIGVGIPGLVNPSAGRIEHAVNLGLVEWEMGGELGEKLGVPVTLENDVNAAALGVHRVLEQEHRRSPADSSSLAYLNLGTGLAAGIVVDGHLWRGATGVAGEIGHIPIDPSGVVCSCGQRGCLETISSGSSIIRQWSSGGGRALDENPSVDGSPVRTMMEAAHAGDPLAEDIRDRLFEGVATAVRLLTLSVDAHRVVLGGGVTNIGDPLLHGVRRVLRQRAESSPFLGSLALDSRVHLVPDSSPIAAIGAALIGEPQYG